jgi:steroid 5-alpha reductase family enzyme
MTDPRFIVGGIIFIAGFGINQAADKKLIGLRKDGKKGYFIPSGGLFNYISCPNFFGEIIEWSGFAIMAWNLPALSFAVWTAANLIPRALDHHKWYRSYFKEEYPESRKAVIPYLL